MKQQFLYGYRLSHEDGSQSRWRFINDNDIILTIRITLRNGSHYYFSEEVDFVYNWAYDRKLRVECCQFEFDPNSMSFTLVQKQETKS